ncbi:MAG: Crp/Fnr family transcriptional regulator [Deltaproteobacteria bacterium]|nr:Crp/Fnr family transcriptional regulator [Deltaproteobacteria bacterium]
MEKSYNEALLDMSARKEDILKKIYLFSGLSDKDLETLSRLAITRRFSRDTTIFWEGREAQGFFILLAGQVKLTKSSPDGKEYILRIVNPGETFGEAAVLAEAGYPASAIALEDCQTLYFAKTDFLGLLSASPTLARNMLATMSRLLFHLTRQLEDLSLKEVSSRLARYVLDRCLEKHGRIEAGLSFDLAITKTHLASYLGTISETLSRTLARLKGLGAINEDRGRIIIKDPTLLQSIAKGTKF